MNSICRPSIKRKKNDTFWIHCLIIIGSQSGMEMRGHIQVQVNLKTVWVKNWLGALDK